jgi:hypothetical protein
MSDRPQQHLPGPDFEPRAELEIDPEADPVADAPSPGPLDPEGEQASDVIVVPHRPGGSWAKFLPPLLVVLLGTVFLAYRSSSRDWRGVFALFDGPSLSSSGPASKTTPASPPSLALNDKAPPADLPKTQEPPAPAPATKAQPPTAPVTPAPEPSTSKPPAESADKPKDEATLDDIKREAEKTRDRIAELEKFKEEEAKRLEDTEDERRKADRNDRMARRFRFNGRPIAPDQVEKMIEALREQHERLLQRMMEGQGELGREFFGDRDQPGFGREPRAFAMPDPFAMPWPPRFPQLDRGRAQADPGRRGQGQRQGQRNDPEEKVFRTPDGGIGRLREFRGPGGMSGFEMRWELKGGDRLGAVVPKTPRAPRPALPFKGEEVPPPPRARVFD